MIFREALRHRPFWVSIFVLLILFVIVASMLPAYDLPDMETNRDKVLHFIGYCGITGFVASIFRGRIVLVIALGLIALGGLIEIAQSTLTTTRSGDWIDFGVDAAGVLVGYLLALTPLGNLVLWVDRLFSGPHPGETESDAEPDTNAGGDGSTDSTDPKGDAAPN